MEIKHVFAVTLAGLTVKISCRYDFCFNMCRDYIVPDTGKYDIVSSATDEEIQTETALVPGVQAPHAEFLCVYRNIARCLPSFSRAVFHGASISYNGEGILFTAPSGTGKTTHIRLWRKYLGENVKIVNGDKPIVSVQNGKATVYGTPWAGKENWQRNTKAPLKAICVLCRGTQNRIEKLSPGDCITEFMRQIYLPEGSGPIEKTLSVLDGIITAVPVYKLYCDISEQAVKTSFQAITGLSYEQNKAILPGGR